MGTYNPSSSVAKNEIPNYISEEISIPIGTSHTTDVVLSGGGRISNVRLSYSMYNYFQYHDIVIVYIIDGVEVVLMDFYTHYEQNLRHHFMDVADYSQDITIDVVFEDSFSLRLENHSTNNGVNFDTEIIYSTFE